MHHSATGVSETFESRSISGMAKRRDRGLENLELFLEAEPSSSRLCIRQGADSEFVLELDDLVKEVTPCNSGPGPGQLVGDQLQFLDLLQTDFSSDTSAASSAISLSLSELLGDPDLSDIKVQEDLPWAAAANLLLDGDGSDVEGPVASGGGNGCLWSSEGVLGQQHMNMHLRAGSPGDQFQMNPSVSQGAATTEPLDFHHHREAILVPGCTCPRCCCTSGSTGIRRRSLSTPAFKSAAAAASAGSWCLGGGHSVSEPALRTGSGVGPGTFWNWTNCGPLHSSCSAIGTCGSLLAPRTTSGMMIPPARSPSPTLAATTAAISALAQVRAHIENRGRAVAPVAGLAQTAGEQHHQQLASSNGDANFSKLTSAASNSNCSAAESRLQLMQLLVSCAEAVACRDARQATALLATLRQATSPHGDAMQRVGACFVEGLSVRIHSSPAAGTFKTSGGGGGGHGFMLAAMAGAGVGSHPPRPAPEARQEALRLLCQSCPYVAFGHHAANTAILEAFAGQDRLHIIDLGMSHGLQWPSLFRALAARAGGKPSSLRITAVGVDAVGSTTWLGHCPEQLQQAAVEAGIAFTFRAVPESLEKLSKFMLDVRDGEALAVNSVLQLHRVVKESRSSLNAVLQSIRKLNPKILTLVEQDASHNGPFFMGRFVEALHYYSAIFDSLDAVLPRYSTQRVKIEQYHFAEEIRNIVACEGHARLERHERVDQWRRRMSRAGFQPLPLKFVDQTHQWLAKYDCAGYTLAEEKGCLILGWNTKPIIAASCWRC